jgi:beta-glucanase (GH16 family)
MGIQNSQKLLLLASILLVLGSSAGCSALLPAPTPTPVPSSTPAPTPTPEWERPGWKLVWQDEFNEAQIDRTKWNFEKGAWGWGNAELEDYTDRPANARIENGRLVITAIKEKYESSQYTSARMTTQRLGQWTYGRVEARIRIPRGQGLWPAFWMLGSDISPVGWPRCGEIDIMENIGKEPGRIHGTVHGPGYAGPLGPTSPYDLATGAFADDFHVYAIEWEPTEIRWYMDDVLYKTLTQKDVAGKWVFDHPFFILLNVAVGGGWPGNPDATSVFPQTMQVEYVRVYEAAH